MTTRNDHSISEEPVAERRTISPALIWYAFLAPPIAWGIHLLLTYFLEAWFCESAMSNVDLWINVATAVLLAATVVAGVLGAWGWMAAGVGDDTDEASEWAIGGFLALSGLMMSILFGLAIIMGDFGVFYLRSC